MNPYLQLQSIRKELLGYRTACCGLVHEQVVLPDAGREPVTHPDGSVHWERMGFCKADTRQWLLTCAHTMAASRFDRLLAELGDTGLLAPEQIPNLEIRDLLCRIYQLDTRKGFAERDLAQLKLRKAGPEEMTLVYEELEAIGQQHSDLVRKVEAKRRDLLHTLDEVLRQAGYGQTV